MPTFIEMSHESFLHLSRRHRRTRQIVGRSGANQEPRETRSGRLRLQPALERIESREFGALGVTAGRGDRAEAYLRRHRRLSAGGVVYAVVEQQMPQIARRVGADRG